MMTVYESVMARAVEQVDLKLTPEEIEYLRKQFFIQVTQRISDEYSSHEASSFRQKLLNDAVNDEATKALLRELVVKSIGEYLSRKRDFDSFMHYALRDMMREEIRLGVVREFARREIKAKNKAAKTAAKSTPCEHSFMGKPRMCGKCGAKGGR